MPMTGSPFRCTGLGPQRRCAWRWHWGGRMAWPQSGGLFLGLVAVAAAALHLCSGPQSFSGSVPGMTQGPFASVIEP